MTSEKWVGELDERHFQVMTICWGSFPTYQDRLAILEQIKIGECVEDLPFTIPDTALTWRIPVPNDTRLSVENSDCFLLDMFCLEFIKIKCYKDSQRTTRWFIWKRVH